MRTWPCDFLVVYPSVSSCRFRSRQLGRSRKGPRIFAKIGQELKSQSGTLCSICSQPVDTRIRVHGSYFLTLSLLEFLWPASLGTRFPRNVFLMRLSTIFFSSLLTVNIRVRREWCHSRAYEVILWVVKESRFTAYIGRLKTLSAYVWHFPNNYLH